MSLYVKATCGNCECKIELYNITLQHEQSFRCPHCLQKINKKQWARLVNAFFTTQDLNYQTKKAHDDYGTGLFTYEFVNKQIPKEKIMEE